MHDKCKNRQKRSWKDPCGTRGERINSSDTTNQKVTFLVDFFADLVNTSEQVKNNKIPLCQPQLQLDSLYFFFLEYNAFFMGHGINNSKPYFLLLTFFFRTNNLLFSIL